MTGGIYLLLGSNLGDREKKLSEAHKRIGAFAQEIRSSSVYSTAAWGKTNQPDFLNQVVEIETEKTPMELLLSVLDVETKMGRNRIEKWGSRTIDIDILFYKGQIVKREKLTIPHPEIQNRMFALAPLLEIAENFLHPALNKSIRTLYEECKDPLPVTRLPQPLREQSS